MQYVCEVQEKETLTTGTVAQTRLQSMEKFSLNEGTQHQNSEEHADYKLYHQLSHEFIHNDNEICT